jgi:hypothetical protein
VGHLCKEQRATYENSKSWAIHNTPESDFCSMFLGNAKTHSSYQMQNFNELPCRELEDCLPAVLNEFSFGEGPGPLAEWLSWRKMS